MNLTPDSLCQQCLDIRIAFEKVSYLKPHFMKSIYSNGMHNSLFLIINMLWICFSSFACNKKTDEKSKPNVIFILTDDQGFGDMNIAGHPYMKTPNIDRLASEGTRFTQF